MHLLETYALSCGLKIDKPYVFEHFTHVPSKKFISFNKKSYPFYIEVISLIKPELDKRGIEILQLKATRANVDIDFNIEDALSFGQWAYLIRHSLLHFGEEDFLFDLAGYYDIPRVILFSNTYPNNFKPYWGSEDKQRILFSTGPFTKPSFSVDPSANFVRYIKPEEIAKNIMELLGISWQVPYETIYAGRQYRPHHDIVEVVPDATKPIELNGRVANLNVRMDYHYDEKFLIDVLEKTKAGIATNKPIPLGLLQALRTKISEIIYIVDENSDVQFVKGLSKLNLPYGLLSYDCTTKLKEKFFEIATVAHIGAIDIKDIKELKGGFSGFHYKSAKRVIHGNSEYKGNYEFKENIPSKPDKFSLCPFPSPDSFLRELEFFFVVKLNK